MAVLSEEEDLHLEAVSQFVLGGLEAGEKVVYIVDSHTADEIRKTLRQAGVDVEATEADGQLEIVTSAESYTREEAFVPDEMIAFLTGTYQEALEEGYEGLRATGEMSWALSELEDLDILFEYEAKLNRFVDEHPAIVLCQYDRRRFSPAALLRVLETHPVVGVGDEVFDSFYYIPPEEYLEGEGTQVMLEHWLEHLKTRQRMEDELRRSQAALEKTVQERTRELEEANVDLESYAHMVAHELKEPVRVAHTHAQLLEERLGELDPETTQILDTVERSLASMTQLVREMLTYAELDRKTQPTEAVDLDQVVDGVLSDLATDIEDRGARVSVHDLPTVQGDPRQLHRVFLHLLDNALQYSEGSPEIEVAAEETAEGWRIEVRDDGEGIDPEHQEQIFEPLVRLHPTAETPGSGMGLAICRRVVDRHGGSIDIESTVDEGTTVTIYLPRRPSAEATGATPAGDAVESA